MKHIRKPDESLNNTALFLAELKKNNNQRINSLIQTRLLLQKKGFPIGTNFLESTTNEPTQQIIGGDGNTMNELGRKMSDKMTNYSNKMSMANIAVAALDNQESLTHEQAMHQAKLLMPITTYVSRLKLAEKIQKKHNKQLAKRRYFKDLKKEVKEVDKLVEDLLDENDHMHCELMQVSENQEAPIRNYLSLQRFDRERALNIFRSKAIEYLYEWRAMPIETNQQFINFWQEPLKVREELEEDIMNEMRGYKLDMKYLKYRNDEKVQWVKQKASLRIEALEEALLGVKQNYLLEIERLNMIIEDYQSRDWNNSYTIEDLERVLANSDKEKIKNFGDSMQRIRSLEKALKAATNLLKNFKKENEQCKQTVNEMVDNYKVMEKKMSERDRFRLQVFNFIQKGCENKIEGSQPYLDEQLFQRLQAFFESEDDEECLAIIDKNIIFEKILEDIEMNKELRICVKEVRKAIKQIGLLTVPWNNVKETGEVIKAQKINVKMIQEQLNHPTIVSMLGIDIHKEIAELSRKGKTSPPPSSTPLDSGASQLDNYQSKGGAEEGSKLQKKKITTKLQTTQQKKTSQKVATISKKGESMKQKFANLKPQELELNKKQVQTVIKNLTDLTKIVKIPPNKLKAMESSRQAPQLAESFNQIFLDQGNNQQDRNNYSDFQGDFDISQLVTFQKNEQTEKKVCILNLEAFSVYLSQNSNNTEQIMRLFEEIIAMNQLLQGNILTANKILSPRNEESIIEIKQDEGSSFSKTSQVQGKHVQIQTDLMRPQKSIQVQTDEDHGGYQQNRTEIKVPQEIVLSTISSKDNFENEQLKKLEVLESYKQIVNILFEDYNLSKNLQIISQYQGDHMLISIYDFINSIQFELMEDKTCSLKDLARFSIQYLFKRALDEPEKNLMTLIKNGLETPKKEIKNIVTKVPQVKQLKEQKKKIEQKQTIVAMTKEQQTQTQISLLNFGNGMLSKLRMETTKTIEVLNEFIKEKNEELMSASKLRTTNSPNEPKDNKARRRGDRGSEGGGKDYRTIQYSALNMKKHNDVDDCSEDQSEKSFYNHRMNELYKTELEMFPQEKKLGPQDVQRMYNKLEKIEKMMNQKKSLQNKKNFVNEFGSSSIPAQSINSTIIHHKAASLPISARNSNQDYQSYLKSTNDPSFMNEEMQKQSRDIYQKNGILSEAVSLKNSPYHNNGVGVDFIPARLMKKAFKFKNQKQQQYMDSLVNSQAMQSNMRYFSKRGVRGDYQNLMNVSIQQGPHSIALMKKGSNQKHYQESTNNTYNQQFENSFIIEAAKSKFANQQIKPKVTKNQKQQVAQFDNNDLKEALSNQIRPFTQSQNEQDTSIMKQRFKSFISGTSDNEQNQELHIDSNSKTLYNNTNLKKQLFSSKNDYNNERNHFHDQEMTFQFQNQDQQQEPLLQNIQTKKGKDSQKVLNEKNINESKFIDF